MQKAGVLFQILADERYANYVRDMLFQYEAMYKDLPLHPKERSYARGKLFWQCLNDSNWLVYVSQAYDAIYDWLSVEERETLEQKAASHVRNIEGVRERISRPPHLRIEVSLARFPDLCACRPNLGARRWP